MDKQLKRRLWKIGRETKGEREGSEGRMEGKGDYLRRRDIIHEDDDPYALQLEEGEK